MRLGYETPVMSVYSYNWNQPFWALKNSEGFLTRIFPQADAAVSADQIVCPSGAIRWCRTQDFTETKSWYPEKLSGFLMPWHRAIDIDTGADYVAAQCIAHAIDQGFRFPEAVN
jgi:CMP-N-acetylneuraminic acid synthetase